MRSIGNRSKVSSYSRCIPSWSDADQSRIIGLSVHDNYRLLVSEYNLQQTKEQFLAVYDPIAAEIYGQKVSLLDGFLGLLDIARDLKVRVALASSSPKNWIDIVLDRFHLRDLFEVVVSADEL